VQWDRLRTFYYVAQAGSFTKAGNQLNISQSAISRQIIDLEYRLKVKLFLRHGRGLHLTDAGKTWFRTVQKMFAEIETTKNLISEQESEPHGHLKIATSSGIANELVTHVTPFLNIYPKMRLSVLIEEDIGLAMRNADVLLFPEILNKVNLVQEILFSSHLKLYANPKYLEKFGTPAKAEDLDHHRLIAYGDHHHPYSQMNWLLTTGAPSGKIREPYMQFNSGANLRAIAEENHGIVTLAKENHLLETSTLVEILPELEGPVIETYFIHPEHLKNSKRVHALLDYLKENLV